MDILASSVDVLLFILCLAAIGFYSYATYTAIEFFRSDRPIDPEFHPPVTIL